MVGRGKSPTAKTTIVFAIISASSVIFLVIYWCMGTSQSTKMSAPVIIPASAKHTATVIFLHGLGDTGHGWSEAFKMIRNPHIKYICPTAPKQSVTLNAGFVMPSWFDIRGLSPDSPEDEAGIKSSSASLQKMVEEETEKNGIGTDRIIIGGFSQGGAVALYSSLTVKVKVAGIIAMSSWLPLHKEFPQALSDSNKQTPIIQCHGEADPVVPFQWGSLTATLLKSFNPNHEFKKYRLMMHSSCQEEMQDVQDFIEKILPAV